MPDPRALRLDPRFGRCVLEVTPDGTRLVVTYKGAQAVGVIDLKTGKELARIPTSRPIPHGVVVTADATLTLAAPKAGLRGSAFVGNLFVADISVPPTVFVALGHPAPTFGPREAGEHG